MRIAQIVCILVCLGLSMSQFAIGDQVCFLQGLNMRSSPCGGVVGTSTGSERGIVEEIKRQQCPFGTYTWIKTKLTNSVWVAFETNLIVKCSSGSRNSNVPMVHQKWDTGDSFAGAWACSSATMVMIVAFFKKLAPKPIHTSNPHPHMNDFGFYVSQIYTNSRGVKFDRAQKDSAGKQAWGAYGTTTDGGGGWAWRMQQYAEAHGLKTKFFAVASHAQIREEINKGGMVALSTDITGSGHIFVVKGYSGMDDMYVNDPWGDAYKPNYGRVYNGLNCVYKFSKVRPKWMVSVWQ